MYRGFQTYRHYINAKLHAISIKICGDRTLLDQEIYDILNFSGKTIKSEQLSVCDLSDKEAANLYHKLLKVLNSVNKNVNTAKSIVGSNDFMTPGQRKTIIKVSKYDFNWSAPATFSFILGVFPEKRKRLSPWEIQNSKLQKLFSLLTKKDADKIIKRLDKIKKRNCG